VYDALRVARQWQPVGYRRAAGGKPGAGGGERGRSMGRGGEGPRGRRAKGLRRYGNPGARLGSPTGLPWGASSFLWPEPDRRVGALKIVTQTQIPVPFVPPSRSPVARQDRSAALPVTDLTQQRFRAASLR